MKKFILIFSLFIFSFSLCKAQVDTLVYKNEAAQGYEGTSKKPNVGYITINVGAGYSLITLALPNGINLGSDGSYNILSVSPSYNFTIDYNITHKFGFGLCGAYQDIVDNPASEGITFTNQTERITRYNIALRLLRHVTKKPKNDAYYGARVGLSIWTDKFIALSSLYPGFHPPTSMPSFSSRPSYQIFFGYRRFLSDCFALSFEVGIGTPYLIEGGISIRFKTRKGK